MTFRRVVCLVAVLSLVAAAPPVFAQEQVELRIAWWGSQNRHDRTLQVIELFEEKYPHIDIQPEFTGWTEYWPRLTTQAAGRNLPDIIQQDYAFLAEWAGRGLVIPLDPFVDDGTISLESISEAEVAGGRIDGRLYGLNLGNNSQTFVYDAKRFEEAGVAAPSVDWTWSEFGDIAAKIRSVTGVYGMGTGIPDNQIFKVWLSEHGQSLYTADGTALGYDDDQLFVDYFEMLMDFADRGATPTRAFAVAQGDMGVEAQLIVTGEAAMGYMWSNQIVAAATAAGRSFEMALLPRTDANPDRPGNYLKPSMFFSITAHSDHPKEAAMFIDFFTNSVEANAILMAERGVPISAEIRQALDPMLDDAQREMFSFLNLAAQHSVPIAPPDPPGHNNIINNVYEPLVDQILYGRLAPDDGAKQFRERASQILSENK